jgi:hypothetical protein
MTAVLAPYMLFNPEIPSASRPHSQQECQIGDKIVTNKRQDIYLYRYEALFSLLVRQILGAFRSTMSRIACRRSFS